jgi:hypothetical protein
LILFSTLHSREIDFEGFFTAIITNTISINHVLILQHHVWVVLCTHVRPWRLDEIDHVIIHTSRYLRCLSWRCSHMSVDALLLCLMVVLGPEWHDFSTELLLLHHIYEYWCLSAKCITCYSVDPATPIWQMGISRENMSSLRILCVHELLMHCSGLFERIDLNYP